MPLRCFLSATAIAITLSGLTTPLLAQHSNEEEEALPPIDVSQMSAAPQLALGTLASSAQRSAAQDLVGEIPGLVIEYNAMTGTPSRMLSTQSFMTARQAQGASAAQVARGFIQENAQVFGLSDADINTLVTTREAEGDASPELSERNLGRNQSVAFEQRWQGRQIYPTHVVGSLTGEGQLLSLAGVTVQDVGSKISTLEPALSPQQAIAAAAENLGGSIDPESIEPVDAPEGSEARQTFEGGDTFDADVPVRLIYFLASADDIRLVWEVVAGLAEDSFAYQVLVDAESGEVLFRESITSHDVPQYRAYVDVTSTPTSDARTDYRPEDNPFPLTPGPATPDGSQGSGIVSQMLETNGDPAASVGGWTADGELRTTGNNVSAFVDLNFDGDADANEQPQANLVNNGGVQTRVFDFPADFTQAPQTQANRDAATVNVFVMANWWHDRMAELGFTEAAGNFQDDNSTAGGVDGDPIRARLHVGTNNSTFGTPPADGTCCPTLNSFTWTGPDPDRDSGFDTEILIHEFTHGLSNRIIGGPNTNGLSGGGQPGGLGEGYSDLYALLLLRTPDEDPDANYVVGGYATFLLDPIFGQPPNWDDNYYFGIRHFPYSTDLCVNPFTLEDMQTATYDITPIPSAGCADTPPVSPWLATRSGAVHDMGEIWAVTVWEARRNLVEKHGAAAGNELMLQLLTDSLFNLQRRPSFIDARDAIFAADLARTGGANRCELWRGFSKRGMGPNAATPMTGAFTEDFSIPEECNQPDEPAFTYAAKFICGISKDPEDFRLTMGRYATTINIRNPGPEVARFTKTLALTFPPKEQKPGDVKEFARHELRPDFALATDCDNVREEVFGGNWPAPYIEGFLVLKSSQSLDVIGVYTKSALEPEAGGVAIDVETVPERRAEQDPGKPDPKERADLIPVPDASGQFCRIRGNSLVVTVRNQGSGAAGATSTRVDFGRFGSVDLPTGPLAPGASTNVATAFPPRCFNPDCDFKIAVDRSDVEAETDETNNNAAGVCLG